MIAKQLVLLCKVALLQCLEVLSTYQNNLFCFFSRHLFMPKPATFIVLPMSINLRKWYIAYLNMLTNFKIVILSVTLPQSVTIPKPLKFRWLRQKVTLCVFLYSRCKDEKFLILIALWTKIYQFLFPFSWRIVAIFDHPTLLAFFRSPNPLSQDGFDLLPSPSALSRAGAQPTVLALSWHCLGTVLALSWHCLVTSDS